MTTRAKTLEDVAADRRRISIWLTAIMMVIYFGFILLIAYNKPLLATPVISGLSLGILLGALTIVAVWVLTYIYVHWANTTYDLHVAELQAGLNNIGNGRDFAEGSVEHLTTEEAVHIEDSEVDRNEHKTETEGEA